MKYHKYIIEELVKKKSIGYMRFEKCNMSTNNDCYKILYKLDKNFEKIYISVYEYISLGKNNNIKITFSRNMFNILKTSINKVNR